jgi:hypothetical protein
LGYQQEADPVSIASLASIPLSHLFGGSRSGTGSGGLTAAAPFTTGDSQDATKGATNSGPASSFQALASDIQAMLIQAQGSATAGGAASSASADAVTPEQKLAADLRTMMSNLQGSGSPNARSASTDPTSVDPGGASGHHHHHHHLHDEARGSTAVADATGTGQTGTGQTGNVKAVSRILAANITQALSAYGGGSSSTG